ncbi:hypothetical protein GUJ93_ZPchr0005g15970 [Zizania palustris]|uniref:Uncharacterized protein n=1 Tax=Zizania palustris TaxID=103762 RepID=A0A8J5T6Q2_ZIZPA|nr:hypothetical protein GUJ93_ZPchr0005g15970 [Zizania palustris]
MQTAPLWYDAFACRTLDFEEIAGFEAKHGAAFPKAVKTDTAAAAPKFYPADDVKPRQPNTRKPTDDIKP